MKEQFKLGSVNMKDELFVIHDNHFDNHKSKRASSENQ